MHDAWSILKACPNNPTRDRTESSLKITLENTAIVHKVTNMQAGVTPLREDKRNRGKSPWSHDHECFLFLFLLWFNVPVNNFSVMLRRYECFEQIKNGRGPTHFPDQNSPKRVRSIIENRQNRDSVTGALGSVCRTNINQRC